MRLRNLDPQTLRAALWTARALRQARHGLRRGLEHVELSRPPRLPLSASRGVAAVLRRRPNTCLERALVLQRWNAEHGDAREVVIGVRSSGREFAAHAWLDGEPNDGSYHELLRLAGR